VDWEDKLDDWELELELGAQLEGSDWVTLEKAAADTGVSRAALRTWYRSGQIPSRLVDGPHGPQRLVPLAMVAERAEASPRVRKTAERRLADEAQLELLRHRVDQLERRLAELEGRAGSRPGPASAGSASAGSASAGSVPDRPVPGSPDPEGSG
jgi:transposase